MNIRKALNEGFGSYQRGDINQAEDVCKKILKKKPNNADALHLLGMIYFQRSDYDLAITYILKAVDIDPNFAEALNNLGNIFQKMNRLDEAISCYQKALKLNPNLVQTYLNLGIVLHDTGKIDEALDCYRRVIELKPDHFGAHNNLGLALQKQGKTDESIACYRKALQINPQFADAYNNLANAYKEKGQLDDAKFSYQRAIDLNPRYAEAFHNLGILFNEEGNFDDAIASYQKALEIKSDYVDAYNSIGATYYAKGHVSQAERFFRHALQIQSNYSVAYSNILFMMNYDARHSPEAAFSEHIRFAELFENPLIHLRFPYLNETSPDRKLKIGYVSPDFKRHSVAYFIEPVLSAHNRNNFEIFCFADVEVPDKVTKRIQGYADNWLSIVGKSDEDVAALIRNHCIDILVDLAGHTANKRILLFARKPAPIQVTWIGYPATTGLSAMDYKIVDRYTDPPGVTERFYTEELIRMPKSFLCYLPPIDCPEITDLPAISTGQVRFGSFNNFAKVSSETIQLWTRILQSVPNARLLLKAKSFSDEQTRQHAKEMFAMGNIDGDRVELLPWEQSTHPHLALYNRIDIALDTFPYHGTTTTCEAMWMGVPVITLAGNTHASRVGVSLLSNIGLPELIATTPEEYVAKAVDLAHDPQKLQSLRKRLRDMMSRSPLTDAQKFTCHLEEVYRRVWIKWCKINE